MSEAKRTYWLDKIRVESQMAREFFSEFLGTFLLILMGDGVVAQVVLSEYLGDPKGSFFTINWGWGVAVTLAILVAGGASGAHINPAVTLALTLVGKFPWKKMFHYMLAQYLGAFVGAVVVYLTYYDAFSAAKAQNNGELDLTWAGIFATYPAQHLSNAGGFFDQVVGTAILLCLVLAITDEKNMKVPASLVPLYVGFVVLNVGICFGYNCGYAINPARDLAPRIFTSMVGWGGEVFTTHHGWSWIPVIATYLGGSIGALIYCFTIGNHWPKEEQEANNENDRRSSSA